VNEVCSLIATTYPAANDLVARMVSLGILEEMTGRTRNRRFRFSSYISLFKEEPQ
jgi:hypothetical protein